MQKGIRLGKLFCKHNTLNKLTQDYVFSFGVYNNPEWLL